MQWCSAQRSCFHVCKKLILHPLIQILVSVEVEGGRVCEVRVRERAPVITVMFKVAQMTEVTLTINSAIFEVCESLRIREYIHFQQCLMHHQSTNASLCVSSTLYQPLTTNGVIFFYKPTRMLAINTASASLSSLLRLVKG